MVKKALVALVLAGCSTVEFTPEPKVYYKRDIRVEVNDEWHSGAFTVSKQVSYKLKIKAADDNDIVLLRTCAREQYSEDEGGTWKVTYTPIDPEERSPACPLRIYSLDAKGKNAFGFMVLQDPEKFKLPVYTRCNGRHTFQTGVSVCQTKEGLLQALVFSEDVVIEPSAPHCDFKQSTGREFVFGTPNRECSWAVVGLESGKEMIHWSLGYEKLMLREQ